MDEETEMLKNLTGPISGPKASRTFEVALGVISALPQGLRMKALDVLSRWYDLSYSATGLTLYPRLTGGYAPSKIKLIHPIARTAFQEITVAAPLQLAANVSHVKGWILKPAAATLTLTGGVASVIPVTAQDILIPLDIRGEVTAQAGVVSCWCCTTVVTGEETAGSAIHTVVSR